MKNVIIVQLRVYKGSKILKDESGKVENENQIVTLKHDTQEWYNYTGKMLRNGYGVAKAETAVYDKGLNKDYTSDYEDVEADKLKEINEEVQKQLIAKNTIAQTPEQKEISRLNNELEEIKDLIKGNKPVKKEVAPKDNTPNIDEELEAARDKYEKLYGKKPHHMAQLKSINDKIAAFKAE